MSALAAGSDFLPPGGMTLEAVARALAGRFEVRDGRSARALDRTYYDTFDGLVHGAGLTLSHGAGTLTLSERDSGAERARLAMASPGERLLTGDLAVSPMRDQLREVVEVRALLPIARVRIRTRAFQVLDDERKTVVRMMLEQPELMNSRGDPALGTRVRVLPVRGYDEELALVRRTLEGELGFAPAPQPLVDEAVKASGGDPAGISSKIVVPLGAQERADLATIAVLRRLEAVIEANLEGTIADLDSEFLHDFRVSVRRTRAVQRELKALFPPEELRHFRSEFRWLQQVTGDSRDLDVYVLGFESMRALVPETMRDDLEPLLAVLRRRRGAARRKMVRAIRSKRTAALLSEWSSFLTELPDRPEEDRVDAGQPISAVAAGRIRKVYRQMVKMGRAIDKDSPPEDYHELRKKGKELRYLLELFGAPLYPGEVVKPMIKSLKALQDVLGLHQDREVQVATLRSLEHEVDAAQGGTGALMAMGVLVARLAEDELAARATFAERFAVFASKAQRKLVTDTFA
ncbi:MAG: CHAD domain-containing protein [Solirubrobacterales bacterium]|nr:CHAD domain-containing protein [Solirubrobacterales bacterium]